MADQPTSLDAHRGMAAQKATELRRLTAEVAADHAALHARQAELEELLANVPAASWAEAVEKTRYLLGLLAKSQAAEDPRRRKLIDQVLADFDRLLDPPAKSAEPSILTKRRQTMASGERRGNREAKKPKQEKPKTPVPVSPFASKEKAPAAPNGSRKR